MVLFTILSLAITGIVNLLGFGATGVVGGSIAAGIMSGEAIASGGGVLAGGITATLQSIGAGGLSAIGGIFSLFF